MKKLSIADSKNVSDLTLSGILQWVTNERNQHFKELRKYMCSGLSASNRVAKCVCQTQAFNKKRKKLSDNFGSDRMLL